MYSTPPPPVTPVETLPEAETSLVAVVLPAGLEWLASPPTAWRAALGRSLARGGISSAGAVGLDHLRKAASSADRAVEMLQDAASWETDPETAALFDNLRLAALHLLVLADHVVRGGDLRNSKAADARGASFGRPITDAQGLLLKRAITKPFSEWAAAAGLSAPERELPALPAPKAKAKTKPRAKPKAIAAYANVEAGK
jgi:hypothetical protein